MKEILFRGKTKENNNWERGFFIKRIKSTGPECYIFNTYSEMEYNVIPETVGQYIGCMDKKEHYIFEGDIVESKKERYIVWFCTDKHCIEIIPIDRYLESNGSDYWNCECLPLYLCDVWYDLKNDIEVIGNVYDNPELLEI